MMTPFLVLNREVAAVDLALRQASAEMHPCALVPAPAPGRPPRAGVCC